MFIEIEKLKAENKLLKTMYDHAMDLIQNSHREAVTITRAFRKRMGLSVAAASGPKSNASKIKVPEGWPQ